MPGQDKVTQSVRPDSQIASLENSADAKSGLDAPVLSPRQKRDTKSPHMKKSEAQRRKHLKHIPDVVLCPIPLTGLLLADRDTVPVRPHNSDSIDIVLLKLELEGGEVSLRPLGQPPLLRDARRGLEVGVLAAHVAAKELELAAWLGALEDLWWGAGKGCDAAWVGEDLVERFGVAAELLLVGEGGDVYGAGRRGCGGCGRGRLLGVVYR